MEIALAVAKMILRAILRQNYRHFVEKTESISFIHDVVYIQ